MSDSKDLRRELRARGASVVRKKSGHYRVSKPGHPVVFISSTPSDSRSTLNDRALLRRYGYLDR